jgi:dTDP-4-amino-4,6-dideoxygalactose transaminase
MQSGQNRSMPPKFSAIPHSRPSIGPSEIDAVLGVLKSGLIAQGPVVESFESAVSEAIGTRYACAVNSGSAALHLTLLALGIGPGTEVIIPSFVCTALFNAVHYAGASPVVADVDPGTGNIDPSSVKRLISPQTAAIIVPHMFGLPADVSAIKDFEVPVIEDCAQSLGSSIEGRMVGSFGVAAVFSFYATKVIATGEGGMVATPDRDLYREIRELREYDNQDTYRTRYNYKMTDMAAAMGCAQMNRLEAFIEKRRAAAKKYDRAFYNAGLRVPSAHDGHIYYRYLLDTDGHADRWIRELRSRGIHAAKPVYKPLHCYMPGHFDCPGADQAWRNMVSIPLYPDLENEDITRVIDAVVELATGSDVDS